MNDSTGSDNLSSAFENGGTAYLSTEERTELDKLLTAPRSELAIICNTPLAIRAKILEAVLAKERELGLRPHSGRFRLADLDLPPDVLQAVEQEARRDAR